MSIRSLTAIGALGLCLVFSAAVAAPPTPRPSRCENGILRWTDDGTEVALFGVNYYAPFSMDWQALRRHHVDPAEALRTDLVHLRRLGLDALRLHCWDREISDPQGNLVDNDHLRLLDLLISEAANQGLYVVLTPIAWWGGADPATNGFSNRFSMQQMTTDAEARACQVRYLAQFMAHANRFTGLRYADDPRIVAIELINEPIYPPNTSDDAVVEYINTLAAAVRGTGCSKPVLYNCWGSREQAAARSTLDGVTFGWYPTGLASGRAITDNRLPAVDRHYSAHTPCLDRLVKAVYEFDAADVPGTVMYPAMARAFRSAGVQVATQFQYDAMALAGTNENWQTHHLNLLYTPGKALSFAIAAEAFRHLPRLTAFPNYPDNTRFASARIAFNEDLSEWVTDTDFLYANTTTTAPPAPASLRRVWGVGDSPVVSYAGTGAYFLDRYADGVWRLQVYPDAVVVVDPYLGGAAEKVRLLWATHRLSLRLPDLVTGFTCQREDSPEPAQTADAAGVSVTPGSYLLVRQGMTAAAPPAPLPYLTPPPSADPATPAARLDVPGLWRQGQPLRVTLTVAANAVDACSLSVLIPGEDTPRILPMPAAGAYRYQAEIPTDWLQPGEMRCSAEVKIPGAAFRFPDGQRVSTQPRLPAHDLLDLAPAVPLPTLEGGGWLRGQPTLERVAGPDPQHPALHLEAGGFGEPPACVAVRLPVPPPSAAATAYNVLTLTLRGGPATHCAEVTLVQADGAAFGTEVSVGPAWRTTSIPLTALQPKWGTTASTLHLERVTRLAVTFGAWLFPDAREETHWLEIAGASLGQEEVGLPVRVLALDAPLLLTVPSAQPVRATGRETAVSLVPGPRADSAAVRLAVPGFGPDPDCSSVRIPVPSSERAALAAVTGDAVIAVPLRAGAPLTDKVEFVVIEQDGTPWGATLPLTREWSTLRLKAADLRFFSHWDHPAGRGGPEDRLRLDQIASVNLCFGAWLYGEQRASPQAIEIGETTLEPVR
jgi:hypothetical protein